MPTRHPIRAACACLALGALLSGCGSKVIDLREPPDPDPLPVASSPTAALQRLHWSWDHRDSAPLDDLFTADYEFQATPADTAQPPPSPLYRDAELAFSDRLFRTGTTTLPAATAITMELVGPLPPEPDSRGKPLPWHQQISVGLHIGVRVPNGDYRIMGQARFFFVRGDSAKIPQRLIDAGYRPDSTRWWIERWEDETYAVPRSMPSEPFTVMHLKTLYLAP